MYLPTVYFTVFQLLILNAIRQFTTQFSNETVHSNAAFQSRRDLITVIV